ncbi:MAG: alpha-ketoglutarate-dependent dioxygenase AlkB [Flavobacteriales bacterium]|nr:alpha-ketoglutarate-dependent dioxygenase AlkB [Candidatus Arcticimaribacter sp.]
MHELFSDKAPVWKPKLPNGELLYFENFWSKKEADLLYKTLDSEIPWRQDPITIFGKTYPQPRLTSLHSINNIPYSYSGITMNPEPISPILLHILLKIKTVEQYEFTSVLLNKYRDGKDSNGWHSDDEKELGINPIIASVSLGAERFFHLRHKKIKKERHKIKLAHGSLLIMGGEMQHYWQHQIAKSQKQIDPRINLTFRKIRA